MSSYKVDIPTKLTQRRKPVRIFLGQRDMGSGISASVMAPIHGCFVPKSNVIMRFLLLSDPLDIICELEFPLEKNVDRIP